MRLSLLSMRAISDCDVQSVNVESMSDCVSMLKGLTNSESNKPKGVTKCVQHTNSDEEG